MTIISDYFWIFESFFFNFVISKFDCMYSLSRTLFYVTSFLFCFTYGQKAGRNFSRVEKGDNRNRGKKIIQEYPVFQQLKCPLFILFSKVYLRQIKKNQYEYIIIAVPKRIFELVAKIFTKIEMIFFLLSNYQPIHLKHNLNEVLKLGK